MNTKTQENIHIIPPHPIKDCWETPEYILKHIQDKFNSGKEMFDPCPKNPTINGLLIDWKSPAYVNPPYSRGRQREWIEKGIEQMIKNNVVSYFLIPSDTSTKLWHELIMEYAGYIYLIKGRIKFKGAPGMPKFGNALVCFTNIKPQHIHYYSLSFNKDTTHNETKLKNFLT